MSGDTVGIRNVRDFRYNNDDVIAEAHYIDQNYKLSEFRNAWCAISHLGDHGLAHVLLSFEFKQDQFLVVSIEARLRKDDVDGYDPAKVCSWVIQNNSAGNVTRRNRIRNSHPWLAILFVQVRVSLTIQ